MSSVELLSCASRFVSCGIGNVILDRSGLKIFTLPSISMSRLVFLMLMMPEFGQK